MIKLCPAFENEPEGHLFDQCSFCFHAENIYNAAKAEDASRIAELEKKASEDEVQYIHEIEKLQAEAASLKKKLEWWESEGVHTCHEECRKMIRMPCDEIRALRELGELCKQRFGHEPCECCDRGYEDAECTCFVGITQMNNAEAKIKAVQCALDALRKRGE